mgnify:CR=1 FL=1
MAKETTYRTKQKEYILNFLEKNQDQHLTADAILEYLKQNNTPVGKSTVYRYLDVLVNQGVVRKYIVEEGKSACYQYVEDSDDCKEHFHLKCNECGKLLHVECDHLSGIDGHILEHHKFKVDNSKTVFYGVCGDCEKV